MYQPAVDWNPQQSLLRDIIRKEDRFDEAIKLCLELHAFVHQSSIPTPERQTLADMVCANLNTDDYAIMPTVKDVTIAWNIWHITRVEDLTMNLLVGAGEQVLDDHWRKRLNTPITDTGNAMTDDEIISLSLELDKTALWDYRNAVASRSRNILQALQSSDMKRKFFREQVEQTALQGGLTAHPDSIWLKDFWGKKDVAGILLLPLTRHQAGHLNDCLKLKSKLRGRRNTDPPF